ncbi:relaxase/mobilization nuclease domain-containing protein [Eoetvoesiella caeni]|uniref:Relaxase/mobilization nuclease-like protein n=1 Tax=Eoetvoesiella caeni TaxID=645616 RepID=A0A366HCN6_9BURK|nr:relaxase/mobilization nuclease domain-containing protein [Eoetvoesiella caeni]MCI2808940.1 relaxase/mobilization nuclease domain-containing protein [Eoetvoesiella caeni]NYT55559.1 relaxase/mobilization nuclease domain-containing protein [Eoetvoesiella caeni]RBP40113.1 relaxase/mobilization nuclease-like protein [Eoetvoesiella caeni]
MILKGSQRSGARQLAVHLLNERDNEHVEVHELRGFASDDLVSALREAEAVSRGTRAKQFLFSLSLNPPPRERVTVEQFERAVDAAERKLGLDGQPRAIVFHEKEGRRHAHVVWSRINVEQMKAINLPHFKHRLQEVSRELYREHGWTMPRGLIASRERDPRNFTRSEWEQAKSSKQDPKALKAMFQQCWAASDSGQAYKAALAERGYTLAAGDRRAVVAIDFRGQVYAVSKWTGLRTKEVWAKLDQLKDLPSVEQATAANAARMTEALRGFVAEAETARQKLAATLAMQRTQIVEKQRKERTDLAAAQEKRWAQESAERAARLNKGIRGLWDRLTGRHAQQTKQNEQQALAALHRDRREKDGLIEHHLQARETLHMLARQQKQAHAKDVEQLHRDIAAYQQRDPAERPNLKEHFREAASPASKPVQVEKSRQPDRGPSRDRH